MPISGSLAIIRPRLQQSPQTPPVDEDVDSGWDFVEAGSAEHDDDDEGLDLDDIDEGWGEADEESVAKAKSNRRPQSNRTKREKRAARGARKKAAQAERKAATKAKNRAANP